MIGTMRVMDGSGDTKLIWDSDKQVEIDNAKETFKKLTQKGYKGFRVKKGGEQGEPISEFDQYAEKIILVAPISGG